MRLLVELQVVSAFGRIKSSFKKTTRAVSSLDEAAGEFGRTLAREVREDVARKGSAGQRFADAPLGQYYLPGKAQKILGFVAPSPRKVVRDIRNVATKPSAGTIAAATGDVVSVATLPLVGTGAVKGAVAVGRGARVAVGARALPLAERINLAGRAALAGKSTVFHGTTVEGAKGISRTGFKGKPFASIRGAGPEVAYVTRDPLTAAKYAYRAQHLKGGSGAKVVTAQVRKGAKPIGRGLGGEAYNVLDLVTRGERGMLKFPQRGTIANRIRARVFNRIGATEAAREQELTGKIAAVKAELGRIGPARTSTSAEAFDFTGSTAQKTERIRAELARMERAEGKVTSFPRKAKSIPRVRKGEQGFMRLPGSGDGGEASREVVRRANLKATRQALRTGLAEIRQELSMETTATVQAIKRGASAIPGQNISKMAQKLAAKELKMRGAMKSVGISPGRVVRQQGSIIEIEGRMPLSVALKRLGTTDRVSQEAVQGLPKMKRVQPGRMPRN